jgi:hypothetical protein
MKILILLKNISYFAVLDTVVPRLVSDGHTILILSDEERSQGKSSWALQTALAGNERISTGFSLRREDGWRRFLFGCRELKAYASYLNRPDQSEYYLKRWEKYINSTVQRAVRRWGWARQVVASRFANRFFHAVETIVPPDRSITNWLKEYCPDVVVATPMNLRFSEEVEYVKAARKLGIPSVVPVYSWDNLTTKGLFQVIPDVVLAWNQAQLDEATQIHNIPPYRVVITGAQRFDEWFNADNYTLERKDFCTQVGLDAQKPYVLYLGSSVNIAQDETWLVKELAQALKRCTDPILASLQMLVRPHPANVQHYDGLDVPGVSVWPKGKRVTDTDEAMQGFHYSLKYCAATVGINTTGMIDAIIKDCPV